MLEKDHIKDLLVLGIGLSLTYISKLLDDDIPDGI